MANGAGMIPGFRFICELGRGGMATVYLVEQESLGREVALKVLAPSLAADADFAERFVREARITAAFRHRHSTPIGWNAASSRRMRAL